jgi:hypothetical protein
MDFIRWWVLKNERDLGEILLPVFIVAILATVVGFFIHVAIGLTLLLIAVLGFGTVGYVFVSRAWNKAYTEYQKSTKPKS